MDANSTGLRGLLDVVKSNRLMSRVIGFLLLMAVMAVIDGGISMMPLILATCAVGTAAVFFWQAGSYRVDIYENGLEIFGGVLTRAEYICIRILRVSISKIRHTDYLVFFRY